MPDPTPRRLLEVAREAADAAGRADIAVHPEMKPWDCGPFPVILAEAGGRFTDRNGGVRIDGGDAVATNGALHDAVLATLRG